VKFVSLCKRGKNRLPVLYKADDSTIEFQTLVKEAPAFDERGELLTLVYAPGVTDSDGDFASDPEAIRSMAYSFMQNGAEIDVQHNGIALKKDQAFPAESFIVQKGDPRFSEWKDNDGNPVDATGAWGAVFKINDPELRAKYRSGEWNGVSLF
jgi:hypothetical protein